jgi:rubrerythrin
MRTRRSPVLVLASSLLVGAGRAAAAGVPEPAGAARTAAAPVTAPASPATVANLAEAYEADVHARERYLAFAAQATAEGQARVAAVFRAAARSEQIRAARHAEALRASGHEPVARPMPEIAARTTRQNLLWMLAHEGAERGSAYPRYVQLARREGHAGAVLTFTEAYRVETELLKLYREALATLGSRGDGEPVHVCGGCGHVLRGQPPGACPVCLSDGAAFLRVE